MSKKKAKRYFIVDHANKRADQYRANPNRNSLRQGRCNRLLQQENEPGGDDPMDKS